MTRADRRPVIVVFNIGSKSVLPGGMSMGSWAHSSSTFLICCRFDQINSARDSHLGRWRGSWEELRGWKSLQKVGRSWGRVGSGWQGLREVEKVGCS